tara:strand:- start:7141 stop:7656 length:516 start_codon:yes stop_codon:yes gene_type:complete
MSSFPSFLNWNLQTKGYYVIYSEKQIGDIESRTAIYSYEDEESLKEGIKEWLVQWFFNSRKALKLPIKAIDANETFKDFLNIIENMDKINAFEDLNKFNVNYAGINFENPDLDLNNPIREAYMGVDFTSLSSITEIPKKGFVRFFSSIGWWNDVHEYETYFSLKSLTVMKR